MKELPAAAGKFFMDKRTKHMRNIMGEEVDGARDAKEMADERVRAERKRAAMKKQELQKRLQTKTRQLKKSAAAGQLSTRGELMWHSVLVNLLF